MNINDPICISPKDTLSSFNPGTTPAVPPPHRVGQRAYTADGCRWRWVLNGAAALVTGNVIQSPAQILNHQRCTAAVAAIGATSITATLGATAATLNQYAEGYAMIQLTPGNGYRYSISGHAAAALSAALTVNLIREETVQVALTTSSKVTFIPNPYSGVIQSPVTTLTGIVVGVAQYPIEIGYYGWIQTWGMACVLNVGTTGVGNQVSAPTTSAGSCAVNSGTLTSLGDIVMTGVDGENCAVFLKIG